MAIPDVAMSQPENEIYKQWLVFDIYIKSWLNILFRSYVYIRLLNRVKKSIRFFISVHMCTTPPPNVCMMIYISCAMAFPALWTWAYHYVSRVTRSMIHNWIMARYHLHTDTWKPRKSTVRSTATDKSIDSEECIHLEGVTDSTQPWSLEELRGTTCNNHWLHWIGHIGETKFPLWEYLCTAYQGPAKQLMASNA